MNMRFSWIVAILSGLLIGPATAKTTADQDTQTVTTTSVVHCVAGASGRTYCGTTHTRYTISGTPAPTCVEGKTWGLDDRGVWVSSGCVADFSPAVVASTTQVVRCDSTGDGRTYCTTAPNVHYILKETREGNCVEGTTWGIDEHGLWVSDGCRGDFDEDSD